MNKILVFTLFSFLSLTSLSAQTSSEIYDRIASLNFTNEFPEKIRETKTVVFVKVPFKSTQPNVRGEWREMTQKSQPGFAKAGIDAVAYYYLDDILSGKESYETFLDEFDERDLKNAIFLFKENGLYKIIVARLQDRQYLLKEGQNAWKIENADLDQALDVLYRSTANSGLERKNMLILEYPEYGRMVKIIEGRRAEFYDLNFSSEKLAVPIFGDTTKIRNAMANYPYKYDLVDPNIPEKDLRKKGFQYILYFVHAAAKPVKEILEYEISDSETDYVSEVVRDGKAEVQSYSVDTPLYKFYIKHIYSTNVFLGKRWDAAPEWRTALENYIHNLRNELVRN